VYGFDAPRRVNVVMVPAKALVVGIAFSLAAAGLATAGENRDLIRVMNHVAIGSGNQRIVDAVKTLEPEFGKGLTAKPSQTVIDACRALEEEGFRSMLSGALKEPDEAPKGPAAPVTTKISEDQAKQIAKEAFEKKEKVPGYPYYVSTKRENVLQVIVYPETIKGVLCFVAPYYVELDATTGEVKRIH